MKLYLSSYEYKDFEKPRNVLSYKKFTMDNRNILFIEVDKPIIGQKYGLYDMNITKLYLLNRVDENAFNHFNKFPIDVHILIIKNKETLIPSSLSQLQNIAWACLYDKKKDAVNHRVI